MLSLPAIAACALALTSVVYGSADTADTTDTTNSADTSSYNFRVSANITCAAIAAFISDDSAVYWPGTPQYFSDIDHWVTSSTQNSACSVEPGSADDVSIIMKVLAATNTPFAVKGGGHALNPGFSSTAGVHIAMTRFRDVKYNSRSGSVEVGPGLHWEEVHAALEAKRTNVTVVGGRVAGVGVAGLSLGGGYSYLSNQYGLTIDNILGYELVLPCGTIVDVDDDSYSDLFWALKGGFNNYGIVTKFIFKAHATGDIWGGPIYYSPDQADAVAAATADFVARNKDPKAVILPNYYYANGALTILFVVFYDGPRLPNPNPFAKFYAIPQLMSDTRSRSYSDFLKFYPTTDMGFRGTWNSVNVNSFSKKVVDQVYQQVTYWSQKAQSKGLQAIILSVEPFLSPPASVTKPSAYPHGPSNPLQPFSVFVGWSPSNQDAYFKDVANQIGQAVLKQAISDGQNIGGSKQILYPNYAPADTPLPRLYGNNVDRMSDIRDKYDPRGVMKRAGGFKV